MKLWSHEILRSTQLCILSISRVNECFQTHRYCKYLLAALRKCATAFAFVVTFFPSVAVFTFPCHVCFTPDILFIKIHGSQITARAVCVRRNTHCSLNLPKIKLKQFWSRSAYVLVLWKGNSNLLYSVAGDSPWAIKTKTKQKNQTPTNKEHILLGSYNLHFISNWLFN